MKSKKDNEKKADRTKDASATDIESAPKEPEQGAEPAETKVPDATKPTTKVGSRGAKTGQASQVIELAITDIVIDATVNVRHDSLNLDTVDAYSETPNLPPVHVMPVEGKYYLADGEHRVQAAAKRGDKTIKAIVVGTGTISDVQDFADFANLKHGLPLTRVQKRQVARRLHDRHPKWSNRELAKKMGATHPTIAVWLADEPMKGGKNLPPAARNSKDGAPPTEPVVAVEIAPVTAPSVESPPSGGSPEPKTVKCPKCGHEFIP